MHHQYRKKPAVIEAFQITADRVYDDSLWPDWLKRAYETGEVYRVNDKLMVVALGGHVLVEVDDWIIMGVKGELYPCKPDIFQETYERV